MKTTHQLTQLKKAKEILSKIRRSLMITDNLIPLLSHTLQLEKYSKIHIFINISLAFFLVSLININGCQSLLLKIRFAAKSADTNM